MRLRYKRSTENVVFQYSHFRPHHRPVSLKKWDLFQSQSTLDPGYRLRWRVPTNCNAPLSSSSWSNSQLAYSTLSCKPLHLNAWWLLKGQSKTYIKFYIAVQRITRGLGLLLDQRWLSPYGRSTSSECSSLWFSLQSEKPATAWTWPWNRNQNEAHLGKGRSLAEAGH